MDWIQATIFTSTMGIEPVTGRLYQIGITGVEIEDESEFNEYLEQNHQYWDYVDDELREKMSGETRVKFYVSNNASGNELLFYIKESISDLKKMDSNKTFGRLDITFAGMSEEDWANNWKQFFKPIKVGKKVLIKPVWEETPHDIGERIIFNIEPGMIFGTGTHETTRLCIAAIEKYMNSNDSVLDLGCGSGILSIITLLLGASFAMGIDIDPNSVSIAYKNAELNGLEKDKLLIMAGNVLDDKKVIETISYKKYDIVLANIVADVIISLTEIIPKQLKDNGILITSGIIKERKEEVIEALLNNHFEILEISEENSWVAIAAKLNKL